MSSLSRSYTLAPTTDQSPNDDHGREEQLLPPPLNMKLSMLFIPHDTPDPEEEDDDGEKHGGSYGHHHQSRALEVIDEERDGALRTEDATKRRLCDGSLQQNAAEDACVLDVATPRTSASRRRRRRRRVPAEEEEEE